MGAPRVPIALLAGLLLFLPAASSDVARPAAMGQLVPPAVSHPAHVLAPAQLAAAGLPPTIQDGIGPGSALQQSGDAGGFLCTAAFLLRDPRTAKYYLSTAGHCLVEDVNDPAAYTGAADPARVVKEVDICVAGCIDNALTLGTYVSLRPSGRYHPVAFAQSGGIGQDFGIIELPADAHDQLRPAMPQWGGPTGTSGANAGTSLVHYGHGTYCCPGLFGVASRTPADQGRTAVAVSSGADSFDALGWVTGGDSGSGIALAVPDAGIMHGTSALGVITHGLEGAGTLFSGTMLTHGVDMVRAKTGLGLQLVEEGDPLTAVADPSAGGPPSAIGFIRPLPGAVVQPTGGSVTIEGNATIGAAPPGNGTHIEVAVDDPTYSFNSRLPVTGNGSWTATWYVGPAASGNHVLHARLVGPDGTLAEANRTVKLQRSGAASQPAAHGASGSASRSATRGSGSASGAPLDADGGPADSQGGLPVSVKVAGPPIGLVAAALVIAVAGRRRPGSG